MELIDFILEAKISGYATGGGGNLVTLDDGMKSFEYEKEGFRYVDKYFGFNPFSGTESIYDENGVLIWVMNYYGQVSDKCESPQSVYEILKLAMQRITPQFPFRGPESFEYLSFLYKNDQSGCISSFSGRETILEKGREFYHLYYHGGSLVQNNF